jgi:quinol monooxygenase YgiN
MIVVIGRVWTDADRRARLIEIGQKVATASRQETGCISYALHQDTEDEHAFLFVEEWHDEAALRRHFATAHIAEFMSTIPDALVAEPDVKFHTVAATKTLADVRRG